MTALLEEHRAVMTMHHFESAHRFFAHAAAGDPASDESRANVRPWFLAEGLLMRAAARSSAGEARRDVDEAIVIAKRLGFWEVALTGYIALATFDEDRRWDHLREAAAIARRIGTPELTSAVDAIAVSNGADARHYQPVVGYFQHLRPSVLRVSFQERTVHIGADAARITRQQFSILAVLALARRPIPRRELAELISSDGALIPERVLEVQLARVRQRLGQDVIVHDGTGYRFGVPFSTDWHDAQHALTVAGDTAAVRQKLDAISVAATSIYERATALRAAQSYLSTTLRDSSISP
jgi:hypothetical protein